MQNLTPADLRKPFHTLEDSQKYANRAQKLLDYIKQRKELETQQGKLYVDPYRSSDFMEALEKEARGEFDNSLGKAKITFMELPDAFTDPGIEKTLSFIKKTEDFGSSSGSGSGAKQTALNEQYTCDVCNLRASKGSDLSNKDTIAFLQKNYPDSSIEPAWINTFTQTANILFNSPVFSVENPVFMYHTDVVKSIENTFKELKGNSGLGLTKWNPADIWAVTKGFVPKLDFKTLEDLNTYLRNEKSHILGISLKKLGQNAHIELFDPADNEKNLFVENNYSEPVIGKTGRMTIAFKGTFQNIKGIVFRMFNTTSNFEGELQGYTAQGGKISIGSVNSYIEEEVFKLPMPGKVEYSFRNGDRDDISKDYDLLRKKYSIDNSQLSLGQNIGMYLCLRLYDYWNHLGVEDRQLFLTNIVYHAASRAPKSSVYLKIC